MERLSADELIREENELFEYNGEDRIVSAAELQKELRGRGKPLVSIVSGIYELDNLTDGFRGGELISISGLTGEGKTLLAQTITDNVADEGGAVLWFTYEVPPEQFFDQFGRELPIFYLPRVLKETSLEWIEQRIWEAKLKIGCQAVFIDHLHYLVPFTNQNISTIIGGVCRRLKQMALSYNVAIFLVAHTAKIKPETEIDIDNIRDSSFVGQESDTVILIWRREKRENGAVVKVAKCRFTGQRNKKVYLIKEGEFLRSDPYDD